VIIAVIRISSSAHQRRFHTDPVHTTDSSEAVTDVHTTDSSEAVVNVHTTFSCEYHTTFSSEDTFA